jgi:hypothetical protein
MQDTHERLSYRIIGERLGITTDAARMKAKREAKAGRWRLIPGNHPNDPVTIEVPVGTLLEVQHNGNDAPPRTHHDGAWERHAKELIARVAELTDAMLAERDAHAEELATVTNELAAARAEAEALQQRLHRRSWIKGRRGV